jgi:phage protein D
MNLAGLFAALEESFLPSFRIFSNGNELTSNYSDRMVSLDIVDSVDEQTDSLTLVLDTALEGEPEIKLPRPGDRIEVELGYNGRLTRIANAFVVDEVRLSGPPDLCTLTCSSTPFTADSSINSKTLVTRRSQSYSGTTLGELANSLASRNGLTAAVNEELASTNIDHIDQVDESDLNLLLRIVRRSGGVLKPMDGKLVIVPEGEGKSVSGKKVSVTVQREECATFDVVHGSKMADIKQVKASAIDYNAASTSETAFDVPKGELWEASK